MSPNPDDRLRVARGPAEPSAVVLMLHGGAERGHHRVGDRDLALRRTRMMFGAIAPRLAAEGVATALLRFTVNGWNARDPVPSPVPDAREALDRLHRDFPGVPLVLLGHSMGARTAGHVADAPGVAGVVGLAPWFPADDPVEQLRGKVLVAAHGSRDKITNPRHTRRFVERAGEVAASARFIDMGPRGHYLLRGMRSWNEVAVRASLDVVRDGCPDLDVGGITHGN